VARCEIAEGLAVGAKLTREDPATHIVCKSEVARTLFVLSVKIKR